MLTSKKSSMLILGITALVGSRTFFALLNDPEGPNLLIVAVLAVILYFLSSLAVRLVGSSTSGLKRVLLTILIQIILVAVLFFLEPRF